MARDGSAVPAERMDISAGSEQEKSQILNAAALLLELAEATGSEQLPHEIEAYLSIAIYKVYRYLYLADPGSIEAVSAPPRAEKPATASLPRSFSVSRSPLLRSASAFRPCRATF